MVFNRFFYLVLLRIILIFGVLLVLSSIFLRTDLFFTQIILVTVVIIQVFELTNYVNRTNLDLSRFLASIKDGDFSVSFSRSDRNQSFRTLNASFSELIDTLKELETEKAAQLHFLNQLVNQIEFGIITFDQQERIELINKKATELLEIPKVSSWRNIRNPNMGFLDKLLELPEGRNQLVEQIIGNQTRFFSVSVSHITILEKKYLLTSFQDINTTASV